VRADPQLASRNYWTNVGGDPHPGPFAKLSVTPIQMQRPAPRLGADQDLPLTTPTRKAIGARKKPDAPTFEGLKVADFAWVGVGPIISKALADHGATVIHVESEAKTDLLRSLPPFKDGEPGLNRSQFFANFNTSKQGLRLELNQPDDLALARKLADWADVVVESFTPGTMARYGLDYPTLSANRSDLVMLSTCMRGQTGPERHYTGFGNQGAALAGLVAITGWPDRAPAGPMGRLHRLHHAAFTASRRSWPHCCTVPPRARDSTSTSHRSKPAFSFTRRCCSITWSTAASRGRPATLPTMPARTAPTRRAASNAMWRSAWPLRRNGRRCAKSCRFPPLCVH
jgi:hypothetical protein